MKIGKHKIRRQIPSRVFVERKHGPKPNAYNRNKAKRDWRDDSGE